MPELLTINNLRAGYGEAVVLPGMSLSLPESQVLALLGRNGTGKTTLINSIVGITRRFGGTLALGGLDITAMRPDQRARAGIGWVPQERNIFRSLTVEENMTAVAQPGTIRGDWAIEIGRNLVHASDSPETAETEIALWFPSDQLVEWQRDDERWVSEG